MKKRIKRTKCEMKTMATTTATAVYDKAYEMLQRIPLSGQSESRNEAGKLLLLL